MLIITSIITVSLIATLINGGAEIRNFATLITLLNRLSIVFGYIGVYIVVNNILLKKIIF